ncbi:MAG TPA: ribosome assembly factor SBDS [Candidatus Omnitrophota bacterium]|nr:ribosome assembly factor SBDS [Candidatus Omnitrophota bacterium]
MTDTTARIKKAGKNFEIIVDLDSALKFRKGLGNNPGAETDKIFTDIKKGFAASRSELNAAFGTDDANQIISEIVKKGEILTTQEFRDEEREKRIKQVIDFLAKNSVDPRTGNPHTSERIKNALEQAHVNIKNIPVENQINDILEQITKIIPISVKMKKIRVTIPAMHTGKIYGIINTYKANEEWLSNGSLQADLSIPSGLVMDFYDKLNSVTHGSALTEELKD